MQNIEELLRRHYEGSITPDEQADLDSLTHRQQVVEKAGRCAVALHRKRVAGMSSVVAVVLVAGVLFVGTPWRGGSQVDRHMVAQAQLEQVGTTPDAPADRQPAVDNQTEEPKLGDAVLVSRPQNAILEGEPPLTTPRQSPSTPTEEPAEAILPPHPTVVEPIVACNTACSPDSVISDIWRFLRT